LTKTLLITKSAGETGILKEYCAGVGIKLLMHSFIRFEPVKAEIPGDIEALFFGSKRAVDFFLMQAQIPAGTFIACIGSVTLKYLNSLGYEVHFSGAKAGDPATVALALKAWLGDRRLHVALSEQSNRSMARVLHPEQVAEIIVYRTLSAPVVIAEIPNLVAFTSPSNVTGFLLENEIDPDTTVIAWGKTTEKALNGLGIQVHHVLEHSTEEELISWLETIQ